MLVAVLLGSQWLVAQPSGCSPVLITTTTTDLHETAEAAITAAERALDKAPKGDDRPPDTTHVYALDAGRWTLVARVPGLGDSTEDVFGVRTPSGALLLVGSKSVAVVQPSTLSGAIAVTPWRVAGLPPGANLTLTDLVRAPDGRSYLMARQWAVGAPTDLLRILAIVPASGGAHLEPVALLWPEQGDALRWGSLAVWLDTPNTFEMVWNERRGTRGKSALRSARVMLRGAEGLALDAGSTTGVEDEIGLADFALAGPNRTSIVLATRVPKGEKRAEIRMGRLGPEGMTWIGPPLGKTSNTGGGAALHADRGDMVWAAVMVDGATGKPSEPRLRVFESRPESNTWVPREEGLAGMTKGAGYHERPLLWRAADGLYLSWLTETSVAGYSETDAFFSMAHDGVDVRRRGLRKTRARDVRVARWQGDRWVEMTPAGRGLVGQPVMVFHQTVISCGAP